MTRIGAESGYETPYCIGISVKMLKIVTCLKRENHKTCVNCQQLNYSCQKLFKITADDSWQADHAVIEPSFHTTVHTHTVYIKCTVLMYFMYFGWTGTDYTLAECKNITKQRLEFYVHVYLSWLRRKSFKDF